MAGGNSLAGGGVMETIEVTPFNPLYDKGEVGGKR